MTATHDIDRLLATWFAADAAETAPAGLVDAIALATATTRRRPGWLSVDRRLPAVPRLPMTVRVVALAALLIAVAIATLIVAGSRPRVPPPFGPALPGLFAMSVDGDIVTASQDGVVGRALTRGEAVETNPTFSRDGTQIAFWSYAPESKVSDLVVMRADGSERRTIARVAFTGPEDYLAGDARARHITMLIVSQRRPGFDWSPDGRFIAYSVSDAMKPQVFVASTEGSGSAPVGDPALKGAFPAWSPDGSLIAFAAGVGDADRGLYLMRPDGTGVRQISTAAGWADAFSATWSPDGHRLVFTAGNGMTELWMVDVDGSNEHKIDEALFVGSPAWAPDGNRLAWLRIDRDPTRPAEDRVGDTYGMNAKVFPLPGAGQESLFLDTDAPFVNWSVDGKYVIGVLTRDGFNVDRLIQFDPDSGESQIITAPGLKAWTQQRLAP